jgi:hypothetical protein
MPTGGDDEDQSHEISDANEDANRNWARDNSCYIVAKYLSMFCLCPKTLRKAKLTK